MPIPNITKQDVINASDQCVMCGLCLPYCPTYRIQKNEAESPRGRIALVRAIYENNLQATPVLTNHLDSCLTCMTCETVCPANVDYAKIIDAGREFTYKQHSVSDRFYKAFLLTVLTNPNVRKFTKFILRIYHALGFNHLLTKISNNSSHALLLFRLIPKPQNLNFVESSKNGLETQSQIVLVNTCASDLLSDQTKNAARHVLNALNCKVVEKTPTQCCGALHQHNGDLKKAHHLIQQFASSITHQDYDALISLATGCGVQLNRHPDLINKHIDINAFVLDKLKNKQLNFKPLAEVVFIHKPCTQGIKSDNQIVEKLLSNIPELELKFFQDNTTCCGAGGINTLTQAKLANKIIGGKINEIKASDATYLVSSNIGCVQHFQANLYQEGRNSRKNIIVCHPITLLAQQLL